MSNWTTSREIDRRIVVWGDLELLSPAHFGSGERGELTDMDLARDAYDGSALLTGTSIAGALRAALLQRERGYAAGETPRSSAEDVVKLVTTRLFGGVKTDQYGDQSPLIIDDAYAKQPQTLVRDGVKLRAETRTADDEAKYDIELLASGAVFPLRFELLLSEGQPLSLLGALVDVLMMLQRGEIRLGARKTRGLGRCRVKDWRVKTYDLRTATGLVDWLNHDDRERDSLPTTNDLSPAFEAVIQSIPDGRRRAVLTFDAAIDGSLLVRGAAPLRDGRTPDTAMLEEGGVRVIPGSSIAGALRARANRIASVVTQARPLIEQIFGPATISNDTAAASRLIVDDAHLDGDRALVQSRVAIDRFTGGAYDTALFAEQPAFGGTTQICLELRCDDTLRLEPAVGLLLLLLKDLWTGDLPLGGTISVGRGRLIGASATLTIPDGAMTLTNQPGFGLDATQRARLEAFVTALHAEVKA